MRPPIQLTRHGWRLLPVHGIVDGRCTCCHADCGSPGKHPRIGAWQRHATTDAATIEAWTKRWPDSNWGVATGAESGIVVLDVDTGDNRRGDVALVELVERAGPLRYVAHAVTGSGGAHYFMRHDGERTPNGANVFGPGIDIRGDGGFAVVAPSMHVSGHRYHWVETQHTGHPERDTLREVNA